MNLALIREAGQFRLSSSNFYIRFARDRAAWPDRTFQSHVMSSSCCSTSGTDTNSSGMTHVVYAQLLTNFALSDFL